MNNSYSARLQNLKARYNPDDRFISKSYPDLDISKLSYTNIADDYVRFAMSAVDNKFTQDIKQAGNNVKEHLQRTMSNVDYEFQGSVMTDTHIKANSDIDLLLISNRFYNVPGKLKLSELLHDYSLDNSQREVIQNIITGTPFNENPNSVLHQNRMKAEDTLSNRYKQCDLSKSKSIHIYNSDLRKNVDVVIACYDDDVFSIKNLKQKRFRGIQIYEKNIGVGQTDHPFFTIDAINKKSAVAHGRLKKMIRFLKNFMFDSSFDYSHLKSFDINIICYNIEPSRYASLHYVDLLFVILDQLRKILNNDSYMASLQSIDQTEKLFYDRNGNFLIKKYNEVYQMEKELSHLIQEIYFNFKKAS